MPDFGRIDAVPVGAFAGCEEEVYGCAWGAGSGCGWDAVEFAVMAAFGMWDEIELGDDVSGSEVGIEVRH